MPARMYVPNTAHAQANDSQSTMFQKASGADFSAEGPRHDNTIAGMMLNALGPSLGTRKAEPSTRLVASL